MVQYALYFGIGRRPAATSAPHHVGPSPVRHLHEGIRGALPRLQSQTLQGGRSKIPLLDQLTRGQRGTQGRQP